MIRRIDLPATTRRDAAWEDVPPDPLEAPELYEGVLWRRVVGFLVDVTILAVLIGGLWLVLVLLGILTFGLLMPLKVLVIPFVPLAYHGGLIGRYGATPGMRLFDLEVRAWTGAPPGYPQAFLMTVLFFATVIPTSWLVLLIALFTDRRRTLHDILSGTLVVRRGRLEAGARPATA